MPEEKAAVGAQGAVTETTRDVSEFDKLIDRDVPIGTRDALRKEVQTLAEWALKFSTIVSDDALRSIEAIKAQIDRMLTEQVNEIIHHAAFQKLEGAWRGLSHLVNNTETDEMLKIRVMNVTKKDLGKTLEKFSGTSWDQSPIFKEIYSAGFGVLGGEPYGCVVGDYHFDHSPQDVALLGEMAKVSAAAHAPFIAGAGPSLLGFGSWQELSNPRALAKIQSTPEHAAWRSLRDSEDSRYIGLAMPRFLARLPYGAKTKPVEEFAFEEDTASAMHDKYTWANSAYAMAVNINRSFKETGWCSQIRGVENGGGVEGLPVHTFPTDDGGVDMKCPTEIAIDDRREKELADLGLMPVLHRKNSDIGVFIAAQSLQKPAEYQGNEVATSNARLAANLPYLFASSRFAHYLKVMVRNKIGAYKERGEVETWLNDWIMQYVLVNPTGKTDIEKARRPLKEARVEVKEVEGNPGYYTSTFYLLPHYQLEGLTVSLRLVAQLPTGKA